MSISKTRKLLSTLLLFAVLAPSLVGAPALAQDDGPEVVQGESQANYTPSILVIATTTVDDSILRALYELGYSYSYYYGDNWTGLNFALYDIVIVAMDGGNISNASVAKLRTDVIDQGKHLILFGGTASSTFAAAVDQYLVSVDTTSYNWVRPSGTDFLVLLIDRMFEKGLPQSYNFHNWNASYYMLRTNDPDINITAVNGDYHTILLYKNSDWPDGTPYTGGSLAWFVNTPNEGYWTNKQDYNVLKRILRNALGHQWIQASSRIDYNRFDCVWFDDGTGPSAYNQKIYCPGGRTSSSAENPSIFRFDPRTGSWTDSGHNLIEGVSNYTALILEDENAGSRGPAIYLIGGYDADNASDAVDMVQRYYPRTGYVEHVSSDPWPVTVGDHLVTPGGCASVQNKIYCFGGWEFWGAPYFADETWEYDPSRSTGSRWQRVVTADLGQARAYIQVAVHDDIIYAMGGHYQYNGGDLVPSTVAEALDVNNLGAGWITLTSMPVASAEGQALSWGGNIYVIGGGDWPDRSVQTMEYCTRTDFWNEFFPNLITARRNHAGALVPLRTADPLDGMPGMWVLGGNVGSDEPPFGWTEYIPLSIIEVYVPLIFRNY